MANPYVIDTDNFTTAVAQLVAAFRKDNPGIDFKCVCLDGTRVSIKHGTPPKAKKVTPPRRG